jgi:aerobic-type carbon monoxide dehydrogenase small subunit (CoxS/CutS family)
MTPPRAPIRVRINGSSREFARDPARSLLAALRYETDLTGTKYGCGEGVCGACAVLLDGVPRSSCQVPLEEADGHAVVTIEGLGSERGPSSVQAAFAEAGGFQCGYCTPGMIIATTAFLRSTPQPSEEQIRGALQDHLCRCGGYLAILRAVHRAIELRAASPEASP